MFQLFNTGVVDTLTPAINLPPVNLHQWRWYQWCTLASEYLSEFSKNLKGLYCYFYGLGEDEPEPEKEPEPKNLVTLSLYEV